MGVIKNTEVPVQAKMNSTFEGMGAQVENIDLKLGDIIMISCNPEDTWSILNGDNMYTTNANGKEGNLVQIGNQNQQFRAGSLVGSFNDGETYFPIGIFSQFTILEGGENPNLKLYCADSDKDNNSGAIVARVVKLS